MKTFLAKAGVFIAVLMVMWGLLVFVGESGRVGELELMIWLILVIAVEWYALRWVGRRMPGSGRV